MTVVCIAGMHRSGTSMFARLLNVCGVYLGEESQLIPPAEDNPEGFWEHAEFRAVNETILVSFGGDWDLPPTLADGWEKSGHLNALRPRVNALINRFSSQRVWGWKDPRNSLTLPYWKSFFPGLKIIVCLRNPYDIHQSLARRGYLSSAFSYNLWLTYHLQLLNALEPGSYLVTHFESYFHDPQSELRRVLDYLGMEAAEKTIEEARQTISSSLRHNRGTIADLLATQAPAELLKIYKELCYMAGHVYDLSVSDEERVALENLAPDREMSTNDYQNAIAFLKHELHMKEGQIQKISEISKGEIERLNGEIERLKTELADIYQSRSWQFVKILQSIKKFILRQD